MKKILLFLLAFPTVLVSQRSGSFDIKENNPHAEVQTAVNFDINKLGNSYGTQNFSKSGINKLDNKMKGSFYLYENWDNEARVVSDYNQSFNLDNVNFDLDDGKFVAKISEDSVFIYTKLKKVFLKNKKFKRFDDEFYELLVEGDRLSLLKKYSGKLRPPVLDKMTNQQIKPAEYKQIVRYFILKNETITEIRLKEKDVVKFIEDDKVKKIKKKIETDRLKYKKEDDLIKIISYYNSI